MSEKRYGICETCGETTLTETGKCTHCFGPARPLGQGWSRAGLPPSVAKEAAQTETEPTQSPRVSASSVQVQLPHSAGVARWLKATQALADELTETAAQAKERAKTLRASVEGQVAAQEKIASDCGRVVATLDTLLAQIGVASGAKRSVAQMAALTASKPQRSGTCSQCGGTWTAAGVGMLPRHAKRGLCRSCADKQVAA